MAAVRLHETEDPLDPSAPARAAQGMDVIVTDRLTAVPHSVFAEALALR